MSKGFFMKVPEPMLAKWREQAKARGYRSVAAMIRDAVNKLLESPPR